MIEEEKHVSAQTLLCSIPKTWQIKVDITELRCRACFQNFDNLHDAAAHVSTDHLVSSFDLQHELGVNPFKIYKDSYICFVCSEKFVSIRALSRHTQTHYVQHTCETCGKSYATLDALKVHVNFSHTGAKIFCRKCKIAFDSVEEKQKHFAESRKCWRYSCNVCGGRFLSPTLRNVHMQTEHNAGDKYACPECSEIFSNRTKRRNHFIATHTSKFQCSCCNKTFESKKSLTNHKAVHSAEKRFQCDVCQKEFSRMDGLRQHMPIHMQDKPYKCTICDKQFNQRVSLRTHVASYHPKAEMAPS